MDGTGSLPARGADLLLALLSPSPSAGSWLGLVTVALAVDLLSWGSVRPNPTDQGMEKTKQKKQTFSEPVLWSKGNNVNKEIS